MTVPSLFFPIFPIIVLPLLQNSSQYQMNSYTNPRGFYFILYLYPGSFVLNRTFLYTSS